MSDARKIVIVGCGPAAVGAAMAARNQDKSAEVLMLSDEDCEPYEKPPLSKAVLTGKAMPQDAPIAGPAGVAGKGITLKPNARVKEIDRGAKAIVTDAGERIPYDALVLATGSINRVLPMFPAGQKGIHYLRTLDEALALKAELHQDKSVLVIGGGVVGLEIASSAADLGLKTTVMEIAPRILARVCDEETSALIHERHRRAGVDIRLGTAATALRPLPEGGFEIDTNTGIAVNADLIVVGVKKCPGVHQVLGSQGRVGSQQVCLAGLRRHHPDLRGRRRHRTGGPPRQDHGSYCAGRDRGGRPLPYLRSIDLCGRRLHALSRPARADPTGELAPRPAARFDRRPQRRGRRSSLHDAAVVLVGAVRHVHSGHGLADRQSK